MIHIPVNEKSRVVFFFKNTRKTKGCWIWTGSKNRDGYGRFYHTSAHRASYEIFKGGIPVGISVLHSCDNPSCVNPNHLWLGTQADNMHDCIAKGRFSFLPMGEKHHKAKLTVKDVAEIRRSKEFCQTLANHYGVHKSTVARIKRSEIWRATA